MGQSSDTSGVSESFSFSSTNGHQLTAYLVSVFFAASLCSLGPEYFPFDGNWCLMFLHLPGI